MLAAGHRARITQSDRFRLTQWKDVRIPLWGEGGGAPPGGHIVGRTVERALRTIK